MAYICAAELSNASQRSFILGYIIYLLQPSNKSSSRMHETVDGQRCKFNCRRALVELFRPHAHCLEWTDDASLCSLAYIMIRPLNSLDYIS
jgi:hypothetical protein